jgi:GNAT superfamily N-acetyltransferase
VATTIRPIEPADQPGWGSLWAGYLAFYETDLPDEVSALTWRRLLDANEPMGGLAAVDAASGELVGICHHVLHRSTWSPTTYCYLEDLFVAPDRRGEGTAGALIEATATTALDAGATKLYWQTHRTNDRARALYDRVASHAGFLVYERDLP